MSATAEGWPRAAPEHVVPSAFAVSLFKSLNDTTPEMAELTLPEMVKRLTKFGVYAERTAAPLWSPARFRDGGERCALDVVSISTLVLDLDHVESLAAPVRLFEELPYSAILHTTFRSTPEAPRCRIVLPLTRPVIASEWPFFHETALNWFSGKLGTPFDPCKDPPRFYFLPSHAAGADHHAQVFHEWDECFLDPSPMIEAGRETAEQIEAQRKARREAAQAAAGERQARATEHDSYREAAIDKELGELVDVLPGGQNVALNRSAFSLASLLAGDGTLDAEWPDIERRMVDIALGWPCSAEAWNERKALLPIRSGYNAGAKKPRNLSHVGAWQAEAVGWARSEPDPDAEEAREKSEPEAGPQLVRRRTLTDTGNAELFVELNCDHARYVPDLGWFINDERRWAHDSDNRILEITKRVTEHIRADADRSSGDERTDKKWKKDANLWAKASESHGRRVAMVRLAEVERSVVLSVDALDRDPYLFNVLNGTIDLRTGDLRPHNPADLITKLAPVTYRPGAKSPRWLAFLDRTFEVDRERIAFVQRFAGYSLTGDTDEQAFAILFGTGANGKSTFVDVLSALFGGYVAHTTMDTFTTNKQGSSGASNALARLFGARLVFATELNKGARLAEATVKQCTGGDAIVARLLYKEYFEFYPRFKLWMVTNHMPRVGTDEAIFRRIKRIPFGVTIPPAERDPKLKARLLEEADGIFNWLVEGAICCLRDGLGTCAAVTASTNEYREDMDPIGDFLEQCARIRPGARVMVPDFYAAYLKFAENERDKPISKKAFTGLLNLRGVESKGGTVRVYVGVELKEDDR
jgi:P4 family phage/plasmid primase-like protien